MGLYRCGYLEYLVIIWILYHGNIWMEHQDILDKEKAAGPPDLKNPAADQLTTV